MTTRSFWSAKLRWWTASASSSVQLSVKSDETRGHRVNSTPSIVRFRVRHIFVSVRRFQILWVSNRARLRIVYSTYVRSCLILAASILLVRQFRLCWSCRNLFVVQLFFARTMSEWNWFWLGNDLWKRLSNKKPNRTINEVKNECWKNFFVGSNEVWMSTRKKEAWRFQLIKMGVNQTDGVKPIILFQSQQSVY